MILTREALLAIDDRPIKRVPFGEGEVCIRAPSAREELAMTSDRKRAGADQVTLAAIGIAAVVCDEKGNRILSVEDAEQLLDKKSALMHAIVAAAHELSGGDDLKGN